MSRNETDRRTVLALLAAGVLGSRVGIAQAQLNALRKNGPGQPLLFLTPEEHELVEILAEMIIPADDHSPGAREAGVGRYIDLVLSNSAESIRSSWKGRISAFEEFANEHCGTPFVEATPAVRIQFLNVMAPRAEHPNTPAEQFFGDFRAMTIFGYYSTEIGLVGELGYKGNQVLAEFPGCPHPRS
jgi:gluconate 2-dehydrogenase gamma chain